MPSTPEDQERPASAPLESTSRSSRSSHAARPAASKSGILGLAMARELDLNTISSATWSLKLKEVSEEAAKSLKVEIISARLIHVYEPTDRDAALFELESNQGKIQAIFSRSGTYSFFWMRR